MNARSTRFNYETLSSTQVLTLLNQDHKLTASCGSVLHGHAAFDIAESVASVRQNLAKRKGPVEKINWPSSDKNSLRYLIQPWMEEQKARGVRVRQAYSTLDYRDTSTPLSDSAHLTSP